MTTTFINFPAYTTLNKYAIVAGSAITSTSGICQINTTTIGDAFYGVNPAAETFITGTYNGGIQKTTSATGPAQTELGTTSDSIPGTLIGDINSLTTILPFPPIVANAVTLSSFTLGQAVRYDAPADLDLSNVTVTFDGLGQIVIHSNTQIGLGTGFSYVFLNGAAARKIYWYATTKITSGAARLPGKFVAGISISIAASTIVDGDLYAKEEVTFAGNTTINPEILCFLKKTKILTENGYTNVENLKVGDNIITKGSILNNDGVILNESDVLKPIKWISNFYASRYDTSDLPICFKVGSLGKNLPLTDLFVSPGHRIIIDGNMHIAKDLVNSETIVQEEVEGAIEYFHFELDCHSVVVAEGVLSETFLELDDSKRSFQN